jgi:ABC-type bacteriocin/lantibiotic exporter with double-glycine peptidase domain
MLKRKRFPISYQFDTMDCGPSCLEMIARYHGRKVSKQLVRSLCQQDRQGTSLAGIARAAEKLGFRTLAVKVSFDDLKQKAPLPCIAFWPHGHFVVIHRGGRFDYLHGSRIRNLLAGFRPAELGSDIAARANEAASHS